MFKNVADHLIADEFSAELAEGVAYVSGHDDESRPVLVIFTSFFFNFIISFLKLKYYKHFFFELLIVDFLNDTNNRFSGSSKIIRNFTHRNCKYHNIIVTIY